MKIIGTGVDMVDLERLEGRACDRIAEFIFLPEEIQDMNQSRNKEQFIASRLAAKEAIIKAYSTPLSYHDILLYKNGPKPQARIRSEPNRYGLHLSITHELHFALAWAIVTDES